MMPPAPPPPGFAAPAAAFAIQPVAGAPLTSSAAKEPLTSRAKNCALVLLVGGALLAIGALLPWETASGPLGSASTDGPPLLLVCGLIVVLLAILLFTANVKRKAAMVTLALAAVGLLDALLNATNASDDVDTAKELGIDAALGAGIFIAIVGAVMAGIASFLLLRATRTGVQPQSSPT